MPRERDVGAQETRRSSGSSQVTFGGPQGFSPASWAQAPRGPARNRSQQTTGLCPFDLHLCPPNPGGQLRPPQTSHRTPMPALPSPLPCSSPAPLSEPHVPGGCQPSQMGKPPGRAPPPAPGWAPQRGLGGGDGPRTAAPHEHPLEMGLPQGTQSPAEPRGPAAPEPPPSSRTPQSSFLSPSPSDTPQGWGPPGTCPISAQRGRLRPGQARRRMVGAGGRLGPGSAPRGRRGFLPASVSKQSPLWHKVPPVPFRGGFTGSRGGAATHTGHSHHTTKRGALATPPPIPPSETGLRIPDFSPLPQTVLQSPPESMTGNRHRAGHELQDGAGHWWR